MAVIVSYVPTPEGHAALQHAVRTARDRGQSLRVVDGSGGRSSVGGEKGEVPYDDVTTLLTDAGVEFSVAAPAAPGANLDDTTAAEVQDPAEDIIIVGIRHRSAVGKFLLGSSTQRLLLSAECPVVVVKATATA
ncbi:universal stress protein [Georgenia sp. Z1491]|uniref:universal stress protein n=1 Tax=Georgenia sp. Z1491 TaxID=3416707 RepID=UPI003CE93979